VSRATAEAEDWRCGGEGGAVWRDAAPALSTVPASPCFIETRGIARMLCECGLSDATMLRAWEASLVRPAGVERLQDLAGIVRYFLRGSSSPRDVGRWLCSPNPRLGGRRPIQVLARWCW
jgi:hypothetical protein